MAESGFDISELTRFTQHLMDLGQKQFPKETKIFLREEGNKLNKKTKDLAKVKVGIKGKSKVVKKANKRYLSGFKRGKVYLHEPTKSYAIRVYNYRPHAHLIESGHIMLTKDKKPVSRGKEFIEGRSVLNDSSEKFKGEFINDVENFVDELLDKGLRL